MFCVSVLLGSGEWLRIRETAQVMWPGETLSHRAAKSFAGMLWLA